MSSHDIPIVFHDATLSRGVKRPPDDSHSDDETQASRARSWHTSRFFKQAHTPIRRHSRGIVRLTRVGGNFSADSDVPLVGSTKSKRRAEDALECTVPTKRIRTCGGDYHQSEGDMPIRKEFRFDSSSSYDASSSPLSKWQTPRTSPLGPKTSTYRRRSREFSQPSRRLNRTTLSWNCVLRNFYIDIISRNPYDQSAQWCQDLHLAGLKDTLHPRYGCPHQYHPSDPEYDEEWPDESWSDEEWSDSEDTLPTSDEDQVEAEVRIVTPEEPPQASTSETFTFVHWNNWEPCLSSKSTMFHSPLSWDAPDGLGTDEKVHHGGALSEPADVVAAA